MVALRQNTKLQDAKYYDADFSRETFTNLYPFLPAHFDILLHLLGALAVDWRHRPSIGDQVVQDVLKVKADQPPWQINKLAGLRRLLRSTTSLRRTFSGAFSSVHQAVGKVLIRFPDNNLHQDIAKSVAVLQILGNLPVSVQNVASLMHPSTSASQLEKVKEAVDEMLEMFWFRSVEGRKPRILERETS